MDQYCIGTDKPSPTKRTRLSKLAVMPLMAWIITAPVSAGQVFDSGSDGSDGALDFTGQSGTIVFDPASFDPPLDPDGDNVFHFTTVTIPAGLTLQLRGLELNFAPVFWLASGEVQIDGTVDLSGGEGHDGELGNRTPSTPGPGGFPGGVAATDDSPLQFGFGPGGGITLFGVPQGASHATTGRGCNNSSGIAPVYGNLFLIPLIGGSGGAGGEFVGHGGGGAGGGALLIASSVSISVDGLIAADGGLGPCVGGLPFCAPCGSGGAVRLLAPVIAGCGEISADGVVESCAGSGGGGKGGLGRVRLEAFDLQFDGTLTGVSRVVTLSPNAPILPAAPISRVRVTSVAGIDVPDVPSGSFLDPDINIDAAGAVELLIETENVPVDATLTLFTYPETGADQVLTPTFIAGTEEAATWSAMATYPNGFSRTFIHAVWTP